MPCWDATSNVRWRRSGIHQRPRPTSVSGHLLAPGAKIQREEFGSVSSFNARYGQGEGEIRLDTFSGDAELR